MKKKKKKSELILSLFFFYVAKTITNYYQTLDMPLACPLCQTELKLHLLQPQLSIISCPSESCIYPFNLSVEELHSKNLLIPITNQEIMTKMKQKFAETNVYENISEFITSRDDDIPQ